MKNDQEVCVAGTEVASRELTAGDGASYDRRTHGSFAVAAARILHVVGIGCNLTHLSGIVDLERPDRQVYIVRIGSHLLFVGIGWSGLSHWNFAGRGNNHLSPLNPVLVRSRHSPLC